MIYFLSYVKHSAAKTPEGMKERNDFENKIMQGDMLGPLVSSNMVDKNIGKAAIETEYIEI